MDEKIYILYEHVNCITNKKYIGITSKTLEERSGLNGINYLGLDTDKKYKHPKFALAILKYGWENFSHNILIRNLSHSEAKKAEIEYIKLNDSFNNGYNASPGGDLSVFSDGTIEKLRKARLGTKLSDETKRKMSNSRKGKPHPIGRNISIEEFKKRVSEGTKAALKNEAIRKKLYSSTSYRKVKVIKIDKNTLESIEEYESVNDAARKNNLKCPTHISAACKHPFVKSSCGYYWKYKMED